MWKRIGLVVGTLLVVCAVLYWVNPIGSRLVPKCPFKLLTGLSCPGCGIQRAIHAAMHGRFGEALAYNYFLPYALSYLAILTVAWVMPAGPAKRKLRQIFESQTAIWIYIVSFMVWMVVRNILHI